MGFDGDGDVIKFEIFVYLLLFLIFIIGEWSVELVEMLDFES